MILYIIIVLLTSGVLSAVIGLERYRMGENAGMRTHALLSIGCSFLMIISIWAIRIASPNTTYDISRLATGAVTGIGFLGAGVIIKDRFTVKGLSTATTLWICSAIGLASGAGLILESIIACIITVFIIFIRNRIIVIIDKNAPHVIIKAKYDSSILKKINDIVNDNSLNVKNIDFVSLDEKEIQIKVYFPYRVNPLLLEFFINELKKDEEIISCTKVMKSSGTKFEHPHES